MVKTFDEIDDRLSSQPAQGSHAGLKNPEMSCQANFSTEGSDFTGSTYAERDGESIHGQTDG